MSDSRKRGATEDGHNDRKVQRYSDDYVVKMLCPGRCAGAIIGSGGEKIAQIKEKTGARVKVTRARETFPGMDERVVTISGSQKQIQDCVVTCQSYIRNDQPPDHVKVHKREAERKQILKLLVAGTSAGRIIGKGGSKIKELRQNHDVTIDVTKPDRLPAGLDENPVSISGETEDCINNCARDIVELIMEDSRSSMKWNVQYDDFNEPPRGGGDRYYDGDRDDGYGGGSSGYRDRPGGYRDGQGGYRDRPGGYRDGPGGYRDGPGGYRDGPGGYRDGPGGYRDGPGGYRDGPGYRSGNGGGGSGYQDRDYGGYDGGYRSGGGSYGGDSGYSDYHRDRYSRGGPPPPRDGYDGGRGSYDPPPRGGNGSYRDDYRGGRDSYDDYSRKPYSGGADSYRAGHDYHGGRY